jgi:hypothetical protein
VRNWRKVVLLPVPSANQAGDPVINLEATRAIHEIVEYQERIALQRRLIAQLTKFGRPDAADQARHLLHHLLLALARMRQRAEASGKANASSTPRFLLSRVVPAMGPRVDREKKGGFK